MGVISQFELDGSAALTLVVKGEQCLFLGPSRFGWEPLSGAVLFKAKSKVEEHGVREVTLRGSCSAVGWSLVSEDSVGGLSICLSGSLVDMLQAFEGLTNLRLPDVVIAQCGGAGIARFAVGSLDYQRGNPWRLDLGQQYAIDDGGFSHRYVARQCGQGVGLEPLFKESGVVDPSAMDLFSSQDFLSLSTLSAGRVEYPLAQACGLKVVNKHLSVDAGSLASRKLAAERLLCSMGEHALGGPVVKDRTSWREGGDGLLSCEMLVFDVSKHAYTGIKVQVLFSPGSSDVASSVVERIESTCEAQELEVRSSNHGAVV